MSGELREPTAFVLTCANCDHAMAHHGHYGPKDGNMAGRWGWIDEGKCWVYTEAERTASGRRKGKPGCHCQGWSAA